MLNVSNFVAGLFVPLCLYVIGNSVILEEYEAIEYADRVGTWVLLAYLWVLVFITAYIVIRHGTLGEVAVDFAFY